MIGWVVATATFWLQRINTVNTLLQRTSFIFAGQIAPLSLMPTALQVISYSLPVRVRPRDPGGDPARRRHAGAGLLYLVGQAVWLGLSIIAFRFAWRAGLREYSAVGA